MKEQKNKHQRSKIILKQKVKRFRVYDIKSKLNIIDRIWKQDKFENDNNDAVDKK